MCLRTYCGVVRGASCRWATLRTSQSQQRWWEGVERARFSLASSWPGPITGSSQAGWRTHTTRIISANSVSRHLSLTNDVRPQLLVEIRLGSLKKNCPSPPPLRPLHIEDCVTHRVTPVLPLLLSFPANSKSSFIGRSSLFLPSAKTVSSVLQFCIWREDGRVWHEQYWLLKANTVSPTMICLFFSLAHGARSWNRDPFVISCGWEEGTGASREALCLSPTPSVHSHEPQFCFSYFKLCLC